MIDVPEFCNNRLRAARLAAPRVCRECGLGTCSVFRGFVPDPAEPVAVDDWFNDLLAAANVAPQEVRGPSWPIVQSRALAVVEAVSRVRTATRGTGGRDSRVMASIAELVVEPATGEIQR